MELRFTVSGMTCAACAARVEKVTKQVPGVTDAQVNLLAGSMVVLADSEDVKQPIMDCVEKAGYRAFIPEEKNAPESKPEDPSRTIRNRILISAAFLIVLMYFTMGHMLGLPVPAWYHGTEHAMVAALVQLFLTLPVVILNRSYYTRGLKALWNRAPNMDTLIAVGSGAALVYGVVTLFAMAAALGKGDFDAVSDYSKNLYFESAAMILTLITLGKYLEQRAKGKTGDAVRQLMKLTPETACVKRDGRQFTIPAGDVKVGDTVIVLSGGRIPVDGNVCAGHASVDLSALTGESVPVEADVGDSVSASAIVTDGYLEIHAENVGADTALAKIIRLVEQAGGSKAPIARLADKIAGVFVPAVMLIAAVTFLVWILITKDLKFALTTAVSVLVISCPCALGLATPVAIMVGTGRGAQMGVLFKNAESLEKLHKIDTVVIDKTGTLTTGRPEVTDILPAGADADTLLRLAATLECRSGHPFAGAIMRRAGDVPVEEPADFRTVPGQGICASVGNVSYYGGNKKLMDSIGVKVPDYDIFAQEGKTPLYFASENGEYLGAILAADVLKEDSAHAVMLMKNMHLRVVMLTGDHPMTAQSIALQAGIPTVLAGVLPDKKAETVRSLRKDGNCVLMVGDGINDAPALATADVGMAIGAGTDIAMESADVVLMNSSLTGVSNAISLSRATFRNIKENLFWAFFYNCLGIPIAAGVLYPLTGLLLSPMIGAAAMSISSVFVVSNALRLRFYKPKTIEKTESVYEKEEEQMMETVIKVNGMMCTHCKARVEEACRAVAGVCDAQADLEQKQVTVSGNVSRDLLIKAITDAGYEVAE